MRTSSVIQLMNFEILFKNVLNYYKGKKFLGGNSSAPLVHGKH